MKRIFLVLALLYFYGTLTAQVIRAGTALEAGMSQERLQKITDMLQKSVEDKVVPGGVAILVRNGTIVYEKAFGYSDAAQKTPFKTNDIFRIASQTKAITTTAAMMLWEEGKFGLDDPISKFIPEFKNPGVLQSFKMADSSFTMVPAGKEITVRMLMTHTSGLGYGVIDRDERFKAMYAKAGITDLFTTKPISIKESVLKLAQLPLHHVPGEKYVYSEGLDVLGYLIEIWSGMPLDAFFKSRIFDVLGMEDTYFYLPASKASRLVPVLTKNTGGNWASFEDTFYDVNYPKVGSMAFFSGGAGLSSTARDYATFLQMHVNGGIYNGKRLLSRKTLEFMHANQVEDLFGDRSGFGLGFSIVNEQGMLQGGQGSVGTLGWGGYFNTQYFADPQEKMIGIILKQTQRVGGDYTADLFKRMTYAAIND